MKGNSQGKIVDLTDLLKANSNVIRRIDNSKGHTLSAFTPVGDVNGDAKDLSCSADLNLI